MNETVHRPPTIAWCEPNLPGRSLGERLDTANALGVGVEVSQRQEPIDLALYRSSGVEVVAVQGWMLHEAHALSPTATGRERGRQHVLRAIEVAGELGAPRLVTVCGFGDDLVDDPFARCVDFFAALAEPAARAGVRLMIEPLSPRRCAVMTDPTEIDRLLDRLDRPDVFSLLLDTGHLSDGGHDPAQALRRAKHFVEELQLRGPIDSAPEPSMPFESWLRASSRQPAVLSVEHHAEASMPHCQGLVARLREAISAVYQKS